MRKLLILSALIFSFTLTGCALESPVGKFEVNYDSEDKSDKVTYIDNDNNKHDINVDSLGEFTDNLLDSVALPDNISRADMKKFVGDTLDSMGTTLGELKKSSDKKMKKFETKLNKKLEKNGVDTDALDVVAILKDFK